MTKYAVFLLFFVCFAKFNFQSIAMEADPSLLNKLQISTFKENKTLENSDLSKEKRSKKKRSKKNKKKKQSLEQKNEHILPKIDLKNLQGRFNFEINSILNSEEGHEVENAQKLQWLANLLLVQRNITESLIHLRNYLQGVPLQFKESLKLNNFEIIENYTEIVKKFENLDFDTIQCNDNEFPAKLFFVIKMYHESQNGAPKEINTFTHNLLYMVKYIEKLLDHQILEIKNFTLYVMYYFISLSFLKFYEELHHAPTIFQEQFIFDGLKTYQDEKKIDQHLIPSAVCDKSIFQFCNQLPCALYINAVGKDLLDLLYNYLEDFFKHYNVKKIININNALSHFSDQAKQLESYIPAYDQLYNQSIIYLLNLREIQSKKWKLAPFLKEFILTNLAQLYNVRESIHNVNNELFYTALPRVPCKLDNEEIYSFLSQQINKTSLKPLSTEFNKKQNFFNKIGKQVEKACEKDKTSKQNKKKKKKSKSQKIGIHSRDIDNIEESINNLTFENQKEGEPTQTINKPSTFAIKIICDKKNTHLYHVKTIGLYDKRIIQWFDDEFSKSHLFKEVYYHAFPLLVDQYLFRIGLVKKQQNKTHPTQIDTVYELFGEIKFKEGDSKLIVFHATKDEHGVCYHRGYELLERNPFFKSYLHDRWWPVTLRDDFPALNQEIPSIKLNESEFPSVISHDELCIKIFDPKYDIRITLFRP